MATLIQICASENDLFGLDGDGLVYQYNFNTSHWMRLGRGRRGYGDSPLAEEGDDDRAVAGRDGRASPEGPRRPTSGDGHETGA